MFSDKYCKNYDRIYAARNYEGEAKMLHGLFIDGKEKKVIDIGCGTGRLGEILQDKYGMDIHGVEPNNIMALQAAERLTGTVYVRKAENLDIVDEYDDGCMMFQVLNFVDKPDVVLKNAARAIRHGGRFVFDFVGEETNIRRFGIDSREILRLVYAKKGDGKLDMMLVVPRLLLAEHIVFSLYRLREVVYMTESAGFKVNDILQKGIDFVIVAEKI